ncbi:MAG: zf-HC2 domain-containing protein [Pseudomonadota bacterium]
MTEHTFTQEQLPWYVAGTLEASATARVRRHLDACVECRDEHAREALLMATMRESAVVDLAPQAGLARMMQRIDAHEARREQYSWLLRPWTRLSSLRSLEFTNAAQATAIILLVGVLGTVLWRGPQQMQEYRTLSNAPQVSAVASTVGAPQLRVVFDDGMSNAEIRSLLDHVDGSIVDGPADGGIFTIELRPATSRPAATEDAIRWLRGQQGVRFAEVVGP